MNKSLAKAQRLHKTPQLTTTRHQTTTQLRNKKRKTRKALALTTASSQTFSTTRSTNSKKPQDEEEEEPELEIITKTPAPKPRQQAVHAAIPSKQPTHHAKKPTGPQFFNTGLPGESIPPEGRVFFEHKARGWLQVVPPTAAFAGVAFPALAAFASYATNFSPEIMTIFGCAAGSAMFAAYQAYKFSQTHVHLMRLMPDNIIQFETFGFFGLKRFVSYPANFIYPIMVDPHHGMFGFRIKFLPLLQEMEKAAGSLTMYDSGLVVAPDVNFRGGTSNQCWNQLLTGSKPFAASDVGEVSKKKAVSMV